MQELSLIDKKLIYELDFNARAPLSKIAKKLNISKQVAKYRIEKLVQRKIIKGFYTDVSASKLGLEIFVVYFKFSHMNLETEKEFVKHMCSQEKVGVNISTNGKWDYCICIWAKNVVHFKRIYQNTMKDYEKYVKSKTIVIETEFYYYKPTPVLDKKAEQQARMIGDIEEVELDKKDKKILSELTKDCRISLLELGKIVKLSPNAIKRRIKELEKKGVILSYRVFIDYQKLGLLHYRVFLHLENIEDKIEKKIIHFLGNQKTVVSITKTMGYCELEFRPIVKDVHEFYQLMEDLRNKFPEIIKEYESLLYFKMHDTWNYYPFSE